MFHHSTNTLRIKLLYNSSDLTFVKASVGKSQDRCEINETQEWITHCDGSFSKRFPMQNKMSIESILQTSISQPASQMQQIAG